MIVDPGAMENDVSDSAYLLQPAASLRALSISGSTLSDTGVSSENATSLQAVSKRCARPTIAVSQLIAVDRRQPTNIRLASRNH